jgi:hypothetical protein
MTAAARHLTHGIRNLTMRIVSALALASLLLGSTAASAAFPALPTVEVALSEPSDGPAPGLRSNPAIATNGAAFLTAWVDSRTGNGDLRLSRIAETGLPADRHAATVGAALQRHIGLTSNGHDWLVSWIAPSAPDGSGTALRLLIVRADGTLIAGLIRPGVTDADVTFDGAQYRLAYVEDGQANSVAIDSSAQFAGSPRFLGSPATSVRTAGSGNGTSLVIFRKTDPNTTGATLVSAFIAANGSISAASVIGGATAAVLDQTAIASDGNGYLVVWTIRDASSRLQLVCNFVSRDGIVTGTEAQLNVNNVQDYQPAITAVSGGGYLVAYTRDSSMALITDTPSAAADVFGIHFDSAGAVTGTELDLAFEEGPQWAPAIAMNGVATVTLFDRAESAPISSGLATVPTSTQIAYHWKEVFSIASSAVDLSGSPTPQYAPAAIPARDGYLVASGEVVQGDGRTSIAIDWIDMFGVIRRTTQSLPSSRDAQFSPAMATNGTSAMIAWLEHNAVAGTPDQAFAMRIDTAGNLLDRIPIDLGAADKLTGNDSTIALVWNGTTFVAAWASGGRIVARQIRIDGTVVETAPLPVSPAHSGPGDRTPALAAGANGTTLLVWNTPTLTICQFTCPFESTLMYEMLSPALATLTNSAQLAARASFPSAAWNGSEFLAVYLNDDGVSAVQINTAGERVTGFTSRGANIVGDRTSVAWVGDGWLFAASYATTSPRIDVYKLSRSLATIATNSLQSTPEARNRATIATRGDGTALIAYERNVSDEAPRIYGRYYGPAPKRGRAATH